MIAHAQNQIGPALIKALINQCTEVRAIAAELLGQFQVIEAIPNLVRASCHTDESVAQAARKSLDLLQAYAPEEINQRLIQMIKIEKSQNQSKLREMLDKYVREKRIWTFESPSKPSEKQWIGSTHYSDSK